MEEYRSLAKPSHFRLFYLDPEPLDSQCISGRLVEYDIDDSLDYECLSYVWGTGGKNASISIDRDVLHITDSLRSALVHLRKTDDIRIIWIDQICIDQENLAERSQQVPHMKRIYERAQHDLVWLGESTYASTVAFDWFDVTFEAIRPGSKGKFSVTTDLLPVDSPDKHLPTTTQQLALREVFSFNPVWQRIWIVQEIILAKEVSLLSGNRALPLLSLELILKSASRQAEERIVQFFHIIYRLISIIDLRRQYNASSPEFSLTHLLVRSQHQKATDPRDNIYGLLGLTHNLGIVPDYEKSVSTVFYETTAFIIKQDKTLEFICFDQSEPQQQERLGLPSWVPDLSTYWRNTREYEHHPIFTAGTDSRRNDIPFSIIDQVLIAQGYLIDTIEPISPTPTVFEHYDASPIIQFISIIVGSRDYARQLMEKLQDLVFRMIPDRFKPDSSNVDAEASTTTQYDTTWRTLMRDRGISGERITDQEIPHLRIQFLEWCKKMSSGVDPLLGPGETDFMRVLESVFVFRSRIAVTRRLQMMVLVPKDADVEDEICVLRTADVPLVMRKISGDGDVVTCKRIGPAYVHGIMDGEAWRQEDMYPMRTYRIV
ncbi:hypothetical protein N0V83_001754 [Neocucurbitaria cava]|uniref:Heterokaryon incompatibility domain-containing protein n=1 Tax=Neocucurbitaria cava TaxID=798079 RepID=A0A9W8YFT4_9PLEO|nr:hypothetical protein N0V83_001754 [Neocucurbitaria cava]